MFNDNMIEYIITIFIKLQNEIVKFHNKYLSYFRKFKIIQTTEKFYFTPHTSNKKEVPINNVHVITFPFVLRSHSEYSNEKICS